MEKIECEKCGKSFDLESSEIIMVHRENSQDSDKWMFLCRNDMELVEGMLCF
jgi:hypothetical protein